MDLVTRKSEILIVGITNVTRKITVMNCRILFALMLTGVALIANMAMNKMVVISRGWKI
jgi:hypothetical protein